MNIFSKRLIQLFTPKYHFVFWARLGVYDNWSDEKYLKKKYKMVMGKELNLDVPKTYNEKLQWLKLHDRKPIYTTMVDKFAVKKYVAGIMGEEYIIPTLGVWDKFEDIDFESLPNQFVLKCTHDSGGLVICKDKATFDRKKAAKKINKSLKRNFYYSGREWPYKDVKPRIIAEKYMSNLESTEDLVEYKLFCFNGVAKMILVCKGKAHSRERSNDYCDRELNRFPFTSLYPNSSGEMVKPKELPELISFAERLSSGIPQVRVDTYLVDGKIYFGELTFFHNSGLCKFEPDVWDETIGEWIELPSLTKD